MYFTLILFIALIILTFSSMAYVYKFRGATRFNSLTEYMRKGQPGFAPLNCLLYMCTQRKGRGAILNADEFEDLRTIKANWQTLRDEAVKLYKDGVFNQTTDPNSAAYYDVGFRTFYKYGWSKFYIKWYGYEHASAKQLCPKTSALLSRLPSVNSAIFSVLPPGGQLTRHLDPVAASLRYHLGLATPNSDNCFINIDGQTYSWRDGEHLLFDETYMHFVKNNTDYYRLILMCDINRPTNFIGSLFNVVIKNLMKLAIVPNFSVDKRGVLNRIFATIEPTRSKVRQLKQTNKILYQIIKTTINFILSVVLIGLLSLIGYGVYKLFVFVV